MNTISCSNIIYIYLLSYKLLMKLDIGCGGEYQGDVNLDLFMSNSPHTVQVINSKYIPNFINGDAHNLPFRNNVFKVVYSSNVIEHLENPLNSLKEMNRVSKDKIIIIVPNNPIIKEFEEHLYSWSLTSFINILNRAMIVRKAFILTGWGGNRLKILIRIIKYLPFALRRKTYRWISSVYSFELVGICQKLDTEKEDSIK